MESSVCTGELCQAANAGAVDIAARTDSAADSLANCIAEAAKKYLPEMQLRGDWSDGDIDFEESFYLLNKTLCPAVLSENGFMTNEQECRWLQTREARQAIIDLHVEGIIEYLEGNI